jgi:hypothetical protein
MAPLEWLRSAGLGLLLALAAAIPAQAGPAAAGECYAAAGLLAPKPGDTAVAIVDASTALTTAQKQQARELLTGELRSSGASLVLYVFARGPGQESVQRVGSFAMPALLDEPWKVTKDKSDAVNKCVRDAMAQVRAAAAKAVELVIDSYTYAPDGESPVVQAVTQVVASHPSAKHFIVISDGLQNQAAGYTLYDFSAARGSQALRRIESRREIEHLARLGTPAMTRGMRLTMYPIGQMEPGTDGKIVQRRLAAEVDALLELWNLLFRRSGAGQISVTSFVPSE